MSGETEKQVSGWTTDTLHVYLQQQLYDLRTMLDERYATQVKAVDAAFAAQQQAMTTALAAAERAVATALQSAEKAVTKAEVAQEKRLESVNEFRGQLSDQASTFVRREDVDVRLNAITDRLSETNTRVTKIEEAKIGAITQRTESRDSGRYLATVIGAVLGSIGIVTFLLSLKK